MPKAYRKVSQEGLKQLLEQKGVIQSISCLHIIKIIGGKKTVPMIGCFILHGITLILIQIT